MSHMVSSKHGEQLLEMAVFAQVPTHCARVLAVSTSKTKLNRIITYINLNLLIKKASFGALYVSFHLLECRNRSK